MAEKTSNTEPIQVHVQLLDEGTFVSRPTTAKPLGAGFYQLLASDNYDPEDENWEYKPGETVKVVRRQTPEGSYLLVVGPNT